MAKRKQTTTEDDGSDAESENSLVDVDFEFFNPNPDVDYIAVKRFVAQQFQSDAELVKPNDLADLVLAERRFGTAIKCDGEESDPYAFLTLVDMHEHRNHPAVKALASYALSKSSSQPDVRNALEALLGSSSTSSKKPPRLGFVFSERLVNMPVQVMPPMYRLLAEEIEQAVTQKSLIPFTHLLFISRIYRLTAEEEAELVSTSPRTKKRQKGANAIQPISPTGGVFSFHPEDEHIQKVSSHSLDFSFSAAQEPREKDAFGLDTGGRMMLVPFDRLRPLVQAIADAYAVA